jgi:hypothetical protein
MSRQCHLCSLKDTRLSSLCSWGGARKSYGRVGAPAQAANTHTTLLMHTYILELLARANSSEQLRTARERKLEVLWYIAVYQN